MASSEAQKAEQPVEVVVERYISNGIGGRGNLREYLSLGNYTFENSIAVGRPSEIKIVETRIDENGEKRRRSSVFTANDGGGRRSSIVDSVVNVLRKKSSAGEAGEVKC